MGRKTSSKQPSSSFWYSLSRSSSAPATPRPEPAAAAEPPIGCMSMVHYLIFAPGAGCVGRPPTSSCNAIVTPHDCHGLADDATGHGQRGSKSGFEAPRNSLDLDADNANDIPIGVQIEPVFDALVKTTMRRPKPTAPSSECETPRTPSLVARLMGIDGLPDQQPTPSPAQHKKQPGTGRRSASTASVADKENNYSCSAPASKEKKKRVIPESLNRREPLRSLSCNAEARSVPDTPRASTSARASWDGPRLSLQALKESVLDRAAQYMSMPSSPTSLSATGGKKKKDAACSRRRRDDKERERVAKEHAREILRQAKETVASRKSSRSSSPAAEKRQSFSNKENMPAHAPAAAVAIEDKVVVVVQHQTGKPKAVAKQQSTQHPAPASHNPHSPCRVALAPRQQAPPPAPQRAKPSRPPPPPPPLDPPTRARRPDGCERFATRIKKPGASSQTQSQSQSQSQSQVAAPAKTTASSTVTDCCSCSAVSSAALEEDPEYSYVRTVLERGGFMRSPPRRPGPVRAALKKQQGYSYSVASPVDPIVFHLLELELELGADDEAARLGPLRHRWNRKLLFHLTQEVLSEELLVVVVVGPVDASGASGAALLRKVWRKVRSFPAADCRVVGDIDALVGVDLEASSVRRLVSHPAVVEEGGDVAEEVADSVLEALLVECVAESDALS